MEKEEKTNKIICKLLSTKKGKVTGKECYDACHKGQDLEIESEGFEVVKSKKQSEEKAKKEKRDQSKTQKETTMKALEKNKCGLNDLTIIKASAIRCKDCPKGLKAYKYHYDKECRDIKKFDSKDPLVEAKNYPIMFFSSQNLSAVNPKEYKKSKKE